MNSLRHLTACLIVCAAVFGGSEAAEASRKGLYQAIRAGNLDEVKRLIGADQSLVSRFSDGYSPLHWAVIDNHIDIARFLLENKADVNKFVTNHSSTPILAARTSDMAGLLIDFGADLKVRDHHSRRTPLQEAAVNGYVAVVKALMEAGEPLDFDSAVHVGWTESAAEMLKAEPALAVDRSSKPLHTAAGQGNLELVRLLLDHGADPDLDYGFANVSGPYTPLSDAVTGGHFEVTRLLLERGANPNVSGGRNHDSLFLFAIAYLEARFTALLLKHGADVRAVDRWGGNVTPLHVAVALGGDAVGVQRVGQPRPLAGDAREFLEKSTLLFDAGADANAVTDDGATPLLFAAIAGNTPARDLLLKHGAKLDIYSACVLRRRAELETMLKAGAKPEAGAQPPLGKSLLHWAARTGDPDLVKLVLRHGGDPNSKAPRLHHEDAGGFTGRRTEFDGSETPLHIAAALGHTDVVRVLIEHGVDLEATRNDFGEAGLTALWLACSGEHRDTVKLLLENGAKPHATDHSSPLYPATGDVQIMRLLLDAARDLDLTGDMGMELIASAIASDNETAVDLLLSRGARLDIFSASALGRTQVVRELIEANPSLVNAVQREYPGAAPLLLAVQNGHPDLVELLLASGAEPDRAAQSSGTTLLHEAAAHGHVRVIEVLLTKGLSLDSRDDTGSGLLHAAASGAHPEVVRFLLSKGADARAVDWSGETPLHRVAGAWLSYDGPAERVADFWGRLRPTSQLLIDAGAAIEAEDDFGVRPLHSAALRGHVEIVELLLSRGADVNARTARYETPLSCADRMEQIFDRDRDPKLAAELLRRHGGVK